MKKMIKKGMALVLTSTMLTSNFTVPAYAGVKDTLSDAASKAKDAASDAADKAKKAASDAAEKAKSSDAAEKASDAIDKAKDAISDAAENAKDTVSDAADAAEEKAEKAKDIIVSAVSNIDPDKFSDGWDYVKKLGGAALSTEVLKSLNVPEYLGNVRTSIDDLKTTMNSNAGKGNTIQSLSGFVAEEWHAGTFNVDAAVKGTGEKATVEGSTEFGSVDVSTSDGKSYGMKYYKNGTKSAKAQATSYMERYQEYCDKQRRHGEKEPTLEEYLNDRTDISEIDEIYDSIYSDQTRIIPSDQMDDAAEYLKKRINKNTAKGTDKSLKIAKSTQETLDNLADHLESEKGTTSKALSSDESKAIAELCREGKFDPADFGMSMSDLIPAKYVFKQAIGAGTSSAVLEAVLEIGPELFTTVVDAMKEGDIDEDSLKEMGIDGAIAGSEGFLEGSVSSVLLMACKSGTFGSAMTDLSPDTIGTMTVLTIDAVKYGYDLANGDITAEEYGDTIAEEAFVACVSQGSGVALQAILPMVPFAYVAGSMAGGMLATSGYQIGKGVVLELKGGSGIEAIVPEEVTDGIEVGKETIAELNIADKVSSFKDLAVSTTKDGLIKISDNA